MSLYSVYFFTGKPGTAGDNDRGYNPTLWGSLFWVGQGSKERQKTPKLGPATGGVTTSQRSAIGGSFVFKQGFKFLIYDTCNILIIEYLSSFYLFTMLLFICLSIHPCACVIHFALRDVSICACVWHTSHVYVY